MVKAELIDNNFNKMPELCRKYLPKNVEISQAYNRVDLMYYVAFCNLSTLKGFMIGIPKGTSFVKAKARIIKILKSNQHRKILL